ncbi:hypothetical protein LQ757_15540 [Agromyces sp. SYSU K20354]|uniref:hypothetical protein n=1 Tax=Agromyces cavernae TaxID=2898659 RepID=UPI001E3A1EEE|nr:hypothetical protein [Agromyces cavernae]MCD2443693.1 hypothetical protein [Agromyces cavernae]
MSVEKRAAFEPPAELVRPVEAPPDMKRPAATVSGAVLVVLRVIAGIVWLVALAAQWDQVLADDGGIDPESAEGIASYGVLAIILVFGAVVLLAQLLLAFAVYRGSNAARLTLMIFATLSIVISWFDYAAGQEITIRTTLVTLALDILVLLALSSRAARAYARRPRR